MNIRVLEDPNSYELSAKVKLRCGLEYIFNLNVVLNMLVFFPGQEHILDYGAAGSCLHLWP